MNKSLVLIAVLALAAQPALASPEIDALREQLRMAEDAGLDEAALQSVRDVIDSLEREEKDLAASAAAAGSDLPASDLAMRKSHFAEIGRSDLEGCNSAGELQLDTICQAAMLRYSDYLATVNGATAETVRAEAWRRHELTAKSYLQALQDYAD